MLLDMKLYKGARFHKESILDVEPYYKPTENFYSSHPRGVTKGFIMGEGFRLLRTNSSQSTFEENMKSLEERLQNRGYPTNAVDTNISEVKFSDRKASLEQKNRDARRRILPFVTHNITRLCSAYRHY